jgi:exodeoxyribonuclease VII small subunit
VRKSPLNLEKSLAELERLVAELERGDLPLEESLKRFERGILLTRQCQSALVEAEQKIEILLDGKLAPFAPQANESQSSDSQDNHDAAE